MIWKHIALSVSALALVACASDDEPGGGAAETCAVDTSYNPAIVPANFKSVVENPLFPLVPGTTLTYQNGPETIVVTVQPEKKSILGVSCTVVHDAASVNGSIVEDTLDYYAEDTTGTVWYMGEDTGEYSNGKLLNKEGSWLAGVDGAKPGTIIPANPTVGEQYRQEYYACHAEDMGQILELNASVTVPAGSYTGCLKTKDFTPLEPAVEEEKFYCPGIGIANTDDLESGEKEELISIQNP